MSEGNRLAQKFFNTLKANMCQCSPTTFQRLSAKKHVQFKPMTSPELKPLGKPDTLKPLSPVWCPIQPFRAFKPHPERPGKHGKNNFS